MQLVFSDVGYRYPTADAGHYALRGLNMTVNSGDFWGVIGHTGSGKSTLIQLAAALLQPTEGQVLLDGVDLARPRSRQNLFTRIGVAFQYPELQLFAPTVAADVGFAARNAGLPPTEIEQRLQYWLDRLGLDYQRDAQRSPFELSGGEQRRVALAGIMIVQPELLILDEPTAGLDPAGRRHLLQIIQEYHAAGHAVMMVSHSMEDIAETTDHILVLKDGQPWLSGSPGEVFQRAEELRQINLGVPAAEGLARQLRLAGLPLPESLLDVPALADALAELFKKTPHAPDKAGIDAAAAAATLNCTIPYSKTEDSEANNG